MLLTRYLTDMLTPHEYSAIMASLLALSDEQQILLEHYRDWFRVLVEAGFIEELSFIDEPSPPDISGQAGRRPGRGTAGLQ
jgi:hypothetical protein